jgi:hypothetical protein
MVYCTDFIEGGWEVDGRDRVFHGTLLLNPQGVTGASPAPRIDPKIHIHYF